MLQRDARSVRLAVQRPRHRLSRAPGLRSQRGRAVGRRAAHGAQRPGLERRHVHARHRLRLPRRGVHHRLLRPGRNRGAGRGESGRVLRLQAGAARRQARRPAPQPRRQGHQDGVRAAGLGRARVDRGRAAGGARSASRLERCGHRRARAAGADHRGALRQPDGHRVGQGRRHRRDLHPAGAPGNGAEPRRPHHPALRAQEPLEGARHRPQHRPAHRRGPRARHPATCRRWRACRAATCWSPT